jgi:phosphoribosylformylglycinamidine cyclo-ligase
MNGAVDNQGMNSTPSEPLTYEKSGIDYDLIDPVKISAQRAAADTGRNLAAHGFSEVVSSRGESAYVVDVGPFYLASIVECLGSKSLVADEMLRLTGRSHYDDVAQDTIAMAVNDLITVGATPLVVQAYWAAGGSDWFADRDRADALIQGWKRACDACGVAWGGGETPALGGIVEQGRIDLAASCTGIIQPKSRLSTGEGLAAGDSIVLLPSSGIHANGLSLARKLALRLPGGYLTEIMPGLNFGSALLRPTALYAPVTEALHRAGLHPRYCANITGHGWRKLMRHPADFTYRIHTLPEVPRVLGFVVEQAGLDPAQAYGTLNMGAGFALFVPQDRTPAVMDTCARAGWPALLAGRVEAGPRQVVIDPIGVTFGADSLRLR